MTALLSGFAVKAIIALVSAGAGWLYRHFAPPKQVVTLRAAETIAADVSQDKAADVLAKDGLS